MWLHCTSLFSCSCPWDPALMTTLSSEMVEYFLFHTPSHMLLLGIFGTGPVLSPPLKLYHSIPPLIL